MTHARYKELMEDDNAKLTDAEKEEGWHFCPEFDGALMQLQGAYGCCLCSSDGNRPGLDDPK